MIFTLAKWLRWMIALQKCLATGQSGAEGLTSAATPTINPWSLAKSHISPDLPANVQSSNVVAVDTPTLMQALLEIDTPGDNRANRSSRIALPVIAASPDPELIISKKRKKTNGVDNISAEHQVECVHYEGVSETKAGSDTWLMKVSLRHRKTKVSRSVTLGRFKGSEGKLYLAHMYAHYQRCTTGRSKDGKTDLRTDRRYHWRLNDKIAELQEKHKRHDSIHLRIKLFEYINVEAAMLGTPTIDIKTFSAVSLAQAPRRLLHICQSIPTSISKP